ncbi:set domain protein [Reticulomyxa filosa]|uniref:Set domain protein n=1 Tax=Reticulomyxa filosa TaxID=46433 RepID=X6MR81_RETFI|nr:set domain protein [Reticulomyxa filosa]|eukprot:ETO15927.1 set domain protein [Reticulomyxa filosa]
MNEQSAKTYTPILTSCDNSNERKYVRIEKITDPKHPAFGGFGLFATKKIQSNFHICDYKGLVQRHETESQTSDYIIQFVDGLSCDAEKYGNVARFINDYRNIAIRPNVKFENYFSKKSGHVRIGVFALNKPIRQGEELLVTYGKGFWEARKTCS